MFLHGETGAEIWGVKKSCRMTKEQEMEPKKQQLIRKDGWHDCHCVWNELVFRLSLLVLWGVVRKLQEVMVAERIEVAVALMMVIEAMK